jgi:hypothetical protein
LISELTFFRRERQNHSTIFSKTCLHYSI